MPNIRHSFVDPAADLAGFPAVKPSNWNAQLSYTNNDSSIASAVVVKQVLTSAATFYVRSADGNDGNNGLSNSSSGAFKSLLYAWNYLSSNFDVGNQTLTIRLIGNGPYSAATGVPHIGLTGFSGQMGKVVLQGDSVSTIVQDLAFSGTNQCYAIWLQNLGLSSPTNHIGIENLMVGRVELVGNIALDNTCNEGLYAQDTGVLLNCPGTQITVPAPSAGFAFAEAHSGAEMFFEGDIFGISGANCKVTFTGTPSYSDATMLADTLGQINMSAMSFVGSVTGVRYDIESNAVINTNGQSTSFIPGSSPGTTTTGGQYV